MSEFSKWDSLCHLTINLELQKQFKKNVNTSKMNDLNSVQKIFQFFE
jgi:acyl carrier protein